MLILSGAAITIASLAAGRAPLGPADAPIAPPGISLTRMSATGARRTPICQRRTDSTWQHHTTMRTARETARVALAGLGPEQSLTIAQMASRLGLHDPAYWTLDAGPPLIEPVAVPVLGDLDDGGGGRAGPAATRPARPARGPDPVAPFVPAAAIGFGSMILLVPACCAGGAPRVCHRARGSPVPDSP
jgi:hypothetical protein